MLIFWMEQLESDLIETIEKFSDYRAQIKIEWLIREKGQVLVTSSKNYPIINKLHMLIGVTGEQRPKTEL